MTDLPTEMGVLLCLMLLAASLWIPYIVGVNKHAPPERDSFQRPATDDGLPDWVARANRAHLNLLEQLLPFAILVLLVDRVDGFTSLSYFAAIAFFWLRVAHAAGMITGIARMPVRPILFTGGWICIALMAYTFFTA